MHKGKINFKNLYAIQCYKVYFGFLFYNFIDD